MKKIFYRIIIIFIFIPFIVLHAHASININVYKNEKKNEKFKICFVQLPSQIFTNTSLNNAGNSSIISESNCDKEIKNEIVKTIFLVKGKINQDILNDLIKNPSLLHHVELRPSTVQILNLNQYLKDIIFPATTNIIFNNTKILSTKDYIVLDEDETLEILTPKEELLKTNNINININMAIINSKTNEIKKFWITTSIQTKTKVFRSIKNIMAFTSESLISYFIEDQIYTTNPEQYFQNKEVLNYYQLNKPLKEGSYLKQNDLVPIPLVKNGQLVNISYQSGELKLSMEAVARSQGYYGETIELTNSRSNKKIWGKVIGLNHVLMER
ncbi:MAG: flagellar basal body P-ring formation protein FlgA [Oligoflexia bacterium]|nr:flagellar basal body P-ring formation protein FlgA [Oligoflexia bacterium]